MRGGDSSSAIIGPPFDPPDGIESRHKTTGRPLRFHLGLSPIFLLALVMIGALAGIFGGGESRQQSGVHPNARLIILAPAILRNGEFFEMRVLVEARADMKSPALLVSPALWRDITINTTMPSPEVEEISGDDFLFKYPGLRAGERLQIKFDGQINPSLFGSNQGEIALYDGTRRLTAVHLKIRVLP